MIELALTICALTFVAPYYDCSEEWDIYVHSEDVLKCGRPIATSLGCATYDAPYENDKIDLIKDYHNAGDRGKHTPKLKHQSVLWHELLHQMCSCDWHEKWDYEKDGRIHRYNPPPIVPETVIQHLKDEWIR